MPPKSKKPLPGGLYNPVNVYRFEKAYQAIKKKIPTMTRTELKSKLGDMKKPPVLKDKLVTSSKSSKINPGPQISAQDFGSTNLSPFKKGGRVRKLKRIY